MAISNGGQKPFPAVVIVVALFLVCLFQGQLWIAHLLPGIAGRATIKANLFIQDVTIPMPVIDLILVPGLFILIYLDVILIYRGSLGGSVWKEIAQRFWGVLSGLLILLFCIAVGGLIAYLVQGHLPVDIRNGIDSLGASTEINLPYAGYKAVHSQGNVIVLVGFAIGVVLYIRKIKRAPVIRQTVKLTREQRMTPYQRMLRERRQQVSTTPNRPVTDYSLPAPDNKFPSFDSTPTSHINRSSSLCHIQPLRTIRPEAVNYRPL